MKLLMKKTNKNELLINSENLSKEVVKFLTITGCLTSSAISANVATFGLQGAIIISTAALCNIGEELLNNTATAKLLDHDAICFLAKIGCTAAIISLGVATIAISCPPAIPLIMVGATAGAALKNIGAAFFAKKSDEENQKQTIGPEEIEARFMANRRNL